MQKWVVDYYDATGIRRWVTCETKREAEDELAKVIPPSRQPRSAPVLNSNITVEYYAEHWLREVAAKAKPLTVTSYKANVACHIVPRLGSVRVRALSKALVKQFLTELLTSNQLLRSSVGTVHTVLRAMLSSAVDDGLLTTNPAKGLGKSFKLVESPRQRQERIKALDRGQVGALLAAADPQHRPLFLVLARTGLRVGEALGLQWDDLNLQDRTAHIERTWSGGRLGTPKSGSGRTVDLSQETCETLRRLQVTRKLETLKWGLREVPAWVFSTEQGTPLDVKKVQRAFRRALKAAKLPGHFSPHSLRHSFASQLIQAGISLAYVQTQLGHASIRLTVDSYGNHLPSANKAAVDALDAGSGSKTPDLVAAKVDNRQSWPGVSPQVGFSSVKCLRHAPSAARPQTSLRPPPLLLLLPADRLFL